VETGKALLLLAPEAAIVNAETPFMPAAAAAWAAAAVAESLAKLGSGADI
jgi:hypothetical protein